MVDNLLLVVTVLATIMTSTLLTLTTAELNVVQGPEYTALTAQQKQEKIWQNVVLDQTPGPALSPYLLIAESMKPSFETKGDQLPGNRKKVVHARSSVGKVEFTAVWGTKYTGIFEGANYGIIRLGLTLAPNKNERNTPGLALKFLRDEVESASLVALIREFRQGQASWNFFKNDLGNHVSTPPEGLFNYLFMAKVATATLNILQVGLSDFAMFDQNGVEVDDPIFPYKVFFRPDPSVNSLFGDEYHGSLADDLATLSVDTVLYQVYALDQPNGSEELIGSIKLKSKLVTSNWGDKGLFFRHQDMREDLALRPEWEAATDKYKPDLLLDIMNILEFILNVLHLTNGIPFI